jgi:hypothetical protein
VTGRRAAARYPPDACMQARLKPQIRQDPYRPTRGATHLARFMIRETIPRMTVVFFRPPIIRSETGGAVLRATLRMRIEYCSATGLRC